MTGALAFSADYTQDELDAHADAFGMAALGAPRLAAEPADGTAAAVRRAVLASALRSLVARRALVLTGTEARPRIQFLEPHAQILETFLRAEEIVSVRHD